MFNCRLVNAFLLPMEVQMGRTPHPFVVGAVHRTWHRFMQGIYSLDPHGDAFLERTLKSLVVSYLPHFGLADNPILKCLDHDGLAAFVLDKIALAFLGKSTKANDNGVAKALQTLQVAAHSTSSEKLKLIVDRTFLATLETMLFNNAHRNLAAEVVKAIALSDCYGSARERVQTQIIALTEKNLAFNTESYFNLVCGTLARLIPEDVRAAVPDIRRQVNAVERMRGIGYDNRLRQGLEKIQSSLSN